MVIAAAIAAIIAFASAATGGNAGEKLPRPGELL
jgi:hypothetical protein